jgi:hypothetical protein
MWELELAAAVARAGASDLAEAARDHSGSVHESRWTTPGATFFEPVPRVARRFDRGGRWVDAARAAQRVDLDEHGRPVVVWMDSYNAAPAKKPRAVWSYAEDRWERLGRRGDIAVFLLDGGRPAWVVGVDDGDWFVERWTWADDRVARVEHAEAPPTGWPSASATVAIHDARGELSEIRRGSVPGDYRDDNRLARDALIDALRGALADASALVADRVNWDRRLDGAEPMPADPLTLAPAAAAAFEQAVVAAVERSSVRRPFCVLVQEDHESDYRVYPPRLLIVADSWRAGMLAAGRYGVAVLDNLWEASAEGHAERAGLAEHLTADGLRACRVLRQAFEPYAPDAEREAGVLAASALGRELARRLNARAWTGTADPFLALVDLGAGLRRNPLPHALRLADSVAADRASAFRACLKRGAVRPPPDGKDALLSREALAALLRAHRLDADADRLAYDVAEHGLRLLPARAGARSRLGGPALLPAGAPWPVTDTGRPLVFLAGIDLAELPAFDERDRWPAAGWLLFFADLELDEVDCLYLEEAGNGDGERARVLYVPPAAVVTPAAAPGRELARRAVRFAPLLTLPERTPELGLDTFAGRGYDDVRAALYHADEHHVWNGRQWSSSHWLAGHRGDYEPGSTLLLHLGYDSDLDFEFLDGGAIRFRVPTGDLARADLSGAVATGEYA